MEPISGSISAEQITGWYDKIRQYLSDFRPEAKSISINFARRTTQIEFHIAVPEGRRKQHRKIKIPVAAGHKILSMIDDNFNTHNHSWKIVEGNYVLDASVLPPSENYLIKMEGSVDSNAIRNILYIKPAASRNDEGGVDKYWLEASIRRPKILEDVYKDLEIDEVNVGVKVDIQKIFGLTIPPEVKDNISAVRRLLSAASSMSDRNELFRAASEYKRLSRIMPQYNPVSFVNIIQQLTGQDVIREYIKLEQPYELGTINDPEYVDAVPRSVNIQTTTRLNLQKPIASGHLTFEREKYAEKLREEFKRIKEGTTSTRSH